MADRPMPEAAGSPDALPGSERGQPGADRAVTWLIIAIEYAIVASLLLLSGVVLVRTAMDFVEHWSAFPNSVIDGIDGILVTIILLDIVHTVFRHLRSSDFPVRPFLVIGILAGIRDILSSSARLTLSTHLTTPGFDHTVISLGVGVGVVVFVLLGLVLYGLRGRTDDTD